MAAGYAQMQAQSQAYNQQQAARIKAQNDKMNQVVNNQMAAQQQARGNTQQNYGNSGYPVTDPFAARYASQVKPSPQTPNKRQQPNTNQAKATASTLPTNHTSASNTTKKSKNRTIPIVEIPLKQGTVYLQRSIGNHTEEDVKKQGGYLKGLVSLNCGACKLTVPDGCRVILTDGVLEEIRTDNVIRKTGYIILETHGQKVKLEEVEFKKAGWPWRINLYEASKLTAHDGTLQEFTAAYIQLIESGKVRKGQRLSSGELYMPF